MASMACAPIISHRFAENCQQLLRIDAICQNCRYVMGISNFRIKRLLLYGCNKLTLQRGYLPSRSGNSSNVWISISG